MENPQFDKSTFTWAIQHFSSLNGGRHYSEIFAVGGHKWRLLIFPKGSSSVDHLSIFLEVPDSATLPPGWTKYADFSLAVVNQIDPQLTIKFETNQLFNSQANDWGFPLFMFLRDVHDLTKGYLVNDTLIVKAEVSAQRVIAYQEKDSAKQTGFDEPINEETRGQDEAVSPSRSSEVNPLPEAGSPSRSNEVNPLPEAVSPSRSNEVNPLPEAVSPSRISEVNPLPEAVSPSLSNAVHHPLPEAESPTRSSEDVGARLKENDYFDVYIQVSDYEGDTPKRSQKHKGGERGGEGEDQNVQRSGVLPEAPRGRIMSEEKIVMVLQDITRGLIPTNLEDPRWPSSAGEMSQTFAPVVKLVDEFKAMKEEVQRLRIGLMTLSEAMKLLCQEGVAKT